MRAKEATKKKHAPDEKVGGYYGSSVPPVFQQNFQYLHSLWKTHHIILGIQASTHHDVLSVDLLLLHQPITKSLNADLLLFSKCIILLMHAVQNCGAAAPFVIVVSFFIYFHVMLAFSSSLSLTHQLISLVGFDHFLSFSSSPVVLPRSLCKLLLVEPNFRGLWLC